MIIEDFDTYPGLVRRYSDLGVYLIDQYGAMYSEAVNLTTTMIEYTETDIPVETAN